jgi:hypothetical protein
MYSGLMTKCMCGEIADEDAQFCADAMEDMMDDDEEGGSIPAECMNEADVAVLMAGGEGSMDMNALSEPCLVAMMEQNTDDESVPDECMNEADLAVLMAGGGGAPNMEDLSEACLVACLEQHNDDDHDGEDHDDDDHDEYVLTPPLPHSLSPSASPATAQRGDAVQQLR